MSVLSTQKWLPRSGELLGLSLSKVDDGIDSRGGPGLG